MGNPLVEQSPLESMRLLRMSAETLKTFPEYADYITQGVACEAGAVAIERLMRVICRVCLQNGLDCKCTL